MGSQIVLVDVIKEAINALKYLIKKWVFIVTFSIATALAGIVIIWLQDSKYTAEMRFVAEGESKGGLGNYASIAAQFGLDLGGASNSSAFGGDNLIELFKTNDLVIKTLLSNNENRLLIEWYAENHKIKTNPKGSNINVDFKTALSGKYNRDRDSIINFITQQILKNQLEVDKLDKKLDIIYIKMKDNNELFAIAFIKTLADNTIKFYTDYKTHKNLTNVNILQHQVDSVKTMLLGNIGQAASISDLNVNPIKQALRAPAQKKQVDLQVNSVLYTELLKNLELAKLSLRRETPLIQIIDEPHLPLKNEKKGRLFAAIIGSFLGGLLVCAFLLIQFFYFPKAVGKP